MAVALESWRERSPEQFPTGPSWQSRPDWRTNVESRLADAAAGLESEWLMATRAFESKRAELQERQDEARQQADEHERALLTAQGDQLVGQVAVTLGELGFVVTDVDATVTSAGDRREDLRLEDSGRPGWIALVEVRGYLRGARLNDLLRLGRFVTRFVADEQRMPDAVWYVVNHSMTSDPDARPAPLASNPGEVKTFAEDGGLVLDTRVLFKLLKAVRTGDVTAEDARQLLREATGVLDLS